MTSSILVTGGAGFIGSHTCVALMEAGYTPLLLDNLCNSDARVVDRLARITGQGPRLVTGDVRDAALLERLFADEAIAGVIHFAGLKAVGDSVAQPLTYYDNNVFGTVTLLQAMKAAGVKTFIFSSSATVYGDPERSPIPETAAYAPANPYGQSKRMVEEILVDLQRAEPDWRVAILRYFNPVGAHESGLIGEHPQGKPNNLMPFVCQVAVGLRDKLAVHGNDYPTPDGTGVRDYVHVWDVAQAHVRAVERFDDVIGRVGQPSVIMNVGRGEGVSVRELVTAFQGVFGKEVPVREAPPRPGDAVGAYANVDRIADLVGWRAEHTIEEAIASALAWTEKRQEILGYE